MTETQARADNVRALIAQRFEGVLASFAKAIERDDAQVWQLVNGERNIGERLARHIERKLALPRKALDMPGFVARGGSMAVQEPHAPYVPVVGTAAIGPNGFYAELQHPVGHGDGYLSYPSRDPNAYAVRVRGDSMRPRVKPGEFVVLEPGVQPSPGDEVLVRAKDGRVMIKVFDFRREGSVQLSSVNEKNPPITLDEAEIECLHYVAAIVKRSMYFDELPRLDQAE